MEVVKTLPLPCKANELDNFVRTVCEQHGVWPTAEITSDGSNIIVTYRTRDAVSHVVTPAPDTQQENA